MRLLKEEKALLTTLVDKNIQRLNGEVRYAKVSGKNPLYLNRYNEELSIMRSIRIKLDK